MKWFFIIAASVWLPVAGHNEKKNLTFRPEVAGANITLRKPVVILELFTSEGCSSCPPADLLLAELSRQYEEVIPLSFHVDYWNRLGWKDPFSKPEFSDRQRDYGIRFLLESIYTPQLVANGEYEMVGSHSTKAESVIKKLLMEKPAVTIIPGEIKRTDNTLSVSCMLEGDPEKTFLLAALVQKKAVIKVGAGENKGSTLSHINIVRSLTRISAVSKINFKMPFPENLKEDNWQLILFTQQKKGLKITGATRYDPQIK